jgi:hypothetical protein
VTAKNKKENFSKTEGVRFWFVDVVK